MAKKPIKITEVVLRDAHQSLLATRMTMDDMRPILPEMDKIPYFSVECWGGATFDSCIRFLDEDPWERLRILRKELPHQKLQMLFRGQNMLGYRPYADDAVEYFVQKSVANGIDVIRIFDALNDARNLQTAIKAANKEKAHVQGCISYTLSPVHNNEYYVKYAKTREEMGADSICIKDMAGLLTPYTCYDLVKELKNTLSIPVDIHSHYTAGLASISLLKGIEAGADIVDTAMSPLSGGTSHMATESLVAALQGTDYDTGLDLKQLNVVRAYFAKLREKYIANGQISPKSLGVDANTLLYQVPGGMFSNMLKQLKDAGKEDKLDEVLAEIPRVREDAGYPPLVTPTSQIVGTQAVFNVILGERYKMVTKEFKGLVHGDYGKTPAPIKKEFSDFILKGEEPITCRPGKLLAPVDFDQLQHEVEQFRENPEKKDLISYAMYPKVYEDFCRHRKEYGYITRMGSHVFFNGMALGETNKINIEDGKTLVIKYLGLGDRNNDGTINVQFELNGMRREVTVRDPHASEETRQATLADESDPMQVGTSIPGMVSKLSVKQGDHVEKDQVLAVIEAMKMETAITARAAGTVKTVRVKEGQPVKAKELLMVLE